MFDEKLKNDVNLHIIVGGDFNDFCIRPLCEQFNFVNKVSSPTRLNSVLDLILIDEDLSTLYADSAVVGPPIKFRIPITIRKYEFRSLFRLFRSPFVAGKCQARAAF